MKHSTAFVLLSKISTPHKTCISNTFLAVVLMLKARKFIPYLSSGVFWNGQRTKPQKVSFQGVVDTHN